MKRFVFIVGFLLLFVFVTQTSFAVEVRPAVTFKVLEPHGDTPRIFLAGERPTLTKIVVDSRNSKVQLRSISFQNIGTTNIEEVGNLGLYYSGNLVAGPASGSNFVVLTFDSPFFIPKAAEAVFELKGDIYGGHGKKIGFDPVLAHNIRVLDQNGEDIVNVYKNEFNEPLVMDYISTKVGATLADFIPKKVETAVNSDTSVTIQSQSDTSVSTDASDQSVDGQTAIKSSSESGVASNPFSDTNIVTLEGKAAADLQSRNIIRGYSDGTFGGNKPVNRAEAMKFLIVAEKGELPTRVDVGNFSDLESGAWYIPYILDAVDRSIVSGYSDGMFRPANTVNTVEFLKMMSLTFSLELNLPHTYNDVFANDWFAPYVGIAEKYDLLPERIGRLEPGKLLTRNEVAVAIYQYFRNK